MKKLTLLVLSAAFGLSSAAGFAATTASAPAAKAEASSPKKATKIHHAKKGEKKVEASAQKAQAADASAPAKKAHKKA
ncbi:acid-shock protein, partial [uncultured Aquitalea sp.]|uniref:acid-shock protein n=2 Tax=uncultured Aquitalea sp. TaxID=540272 RepID=UPI0025ED8D57